MSQPLHIPLPLTILLVEKTGELKTLNVKDYKEDACYYNRSAYGWLTILKQDVEHLLRL